MNPSASLYGAQAARSFYQPSYFGGGAPQFNLGVQTGAFAPSIFSAFQPTFVLGGGANGQTNVYNNAIWNQRQQFNQNQSIYGGGYGFQQPAYNVGSFYGYQQQQPSYNYGYNNYYQQPFDYNLNPVNQLGAHFNERSFPTSYNPFSTPWAPTDVLQTNSSDHVLYSGQQVVDTQTNAVDNLFKIAPGAYGVKLTLTRGNDHAMIGSGAYNNIITIPDGVNNSGSSSGVKQITVSESAYGNIINAPKLSTNGPTYVVFGGFENEYRQDPIQGPNGVPGIVYTNLKTGAQNSVFGEHRGLFTKLTN